MRKKKAISLEEKIDIISESLFSTHNKLSIKYSVSRTAVISIVKNKDSIHAAVNAGFDKKRKNLTSTRFDVLEFLVIL